jgi:hypothetical protein
MSKTAWVRWASLAEVCMQAAEALTYGNGSCDNVEANGERREAGILEL